MKFGRALPRKCSGSPDSSSAEARSPRECRAKPSHERPLLFLGAKCLDHQGRVATAPPPPVCLCVCRGPAGIQAASARSRTGPQASRPEFAEKPCSLSLCWQCVIHAMGSGSGGHEVPKGTSKVDLYVLISGHGEDETGPASRRCMVGVRFGAPRGGRGRLEWQGHIGELGLDVPGEGRSEIPCPPLMSGAQGSHFVEVGCRGIRCQGPQPVRLTSSRPAPPCSLDSEPCSPISVRESQLRSLRTSCRCWRPPGSTQGAQPSVDPKISCPARQRPPKHCR